MIQTPLCHLLGIEYPIVQGGMAFLGEFSLVSAVCDAGGLGVIGAGNSPPDWIREQIRHVRRSTPHPFGVNIMLMSPFTTEVVKVVEEEKVPVVFFGGGNPGAYIPALKEQEIKVIPVISSVLLGIRLQRLGADAVVAEGMESGGHIGETTTMSLIPQMVDGLHISVIAAGGIADGRGMAAALMLGAQGIQMGTRFICTEECIAHPSFKQKILEAGDRATAVTGQEWGHPVRCLKNKLTRKLLTLSKSSAEELGRGRLEKGLIEGDVEYGSLMAGQIAGLIREIKPVREVIQEVMKEAEEAILCLPERVALSG